MVRLVFRLYAQIQRPICTLGALRASTKLSYGFTLSKHRSPSFGSCDSRLTHTAGKVVCVCCWNNNRCSVAGIALAFAAHLTRICVDTCESHHTPWSVFQDGTNATFTSQLSPQSLFHELAAVTTLTHPGGWESNEAFTHSNNTVEVFGRAERCIRFPFNSFTYFSLSVQSALQLSLTVLVCYRTHYHI